MSNFQSGYPELFWNKQYLPFLYENVDYKGFGSDTEMFGEFGNNQSTTIIKTQLYADVGMEGKKQLLHEFEWKVLCKGGLTDNQDVKELCSAINCSNPYLWGARHNNRFRHGSSGLMSIKICMVLLLVPHGDLILLPIQIQLSTLTFCFHQG